MSVELCFIVTRASNVGVLLAYCACLPLLSFSFLSFVVLSHGNWVVLIVIVRIIQ